MNYPLKKQSPQPLGLIFSILSLFVGGTGGFVIGFILGLIGGILGLTWKPSEEAPPPRRHHSYNELFILSLKLPQLS
ncbi:MAG: DUF6114 domain-containing protein [Candidatus Bathyarchaeia archaeon]